jgi:hypothetical protein
MEPHLHHSLKSSTHFGFNIDLNLNLLDNQIGDEGKGPSVQQNISTPSPNNLECSVGMPTKFLEVVVKAKIFMVWKLFDKNDANDRILFKLIL